VVYLPVCFACDHGTLITTAALLGSPDGASKSLQDDDDFGSHRRPVAAGHQSVPLSGIPVPGLTSDSMGDPRRRRRPLYRSFAERLNTLSTTQSTSIFFSHKCTTSHIVDSGSFGKITIFVGKIRVQHKSACAVQILIQKLLGFYTLSNE
jgi:hypothetical protein